MSQSTIWTSCLNPSDGRCQIQLANNKFDYSEGVNYYFTGDIIIRDKVSHEFIHNTVSNILSNNFVEPCVIPFYENEVYVSPIFGSVGICVTGEASVYKSNNISISLNQTSNVTILVQSDAEVNGNTYSANSSRVYTTHYIKNLQEYCNVQSSLPVIAIIE